MQKLFYILFTVSIALHMPLLAQQNICDSKTELTATNGTNGTWKVKSGTGTFTSPNSLSTEVNNIGIGENIFVWEYTENAIIQKEEYSVIRHQLVIEKSLQKDGTLKASVYSAQNRENVGKWFVITGNPIDDYHQSNSIDIELKLGENILQWQNFDRNCIANIYFNLEEGLFSAGEDKAVCSNTSYLEAQDPSSRSGHWKVVAGNGIFENSLSHETKVTGLYEGENTFEWTVENGDFTTSSRVKVTNNSFETYAGQDPFSSTQSTTYNLSATAPPPGGTGMWSVIGGAGAFLRADQNETSVYNMKIGINTYEWEVTWHGCTAKDQVSIKRAFVDVNAGPDQVICSDSTQLAGQENRQGNGIWEVIEGSAIFENPEQYNTKVKGLAVGENILKWTISKSGVSVSDIMSIHNHSFNAYAGESLVTENKTVTLDAQDYTDSQTRWKLIKGNAFFSDENAHNSTITLLENGENILEWQVAKKISAYSNDIYCKSSDRISIYKESDINHVDFILPIENACSPFQLKCLNSSSKSNGYTYSWFIDDTETSNTRDLEHEFILEGNKEKEVTIKLQVRKPSGELKETTKTFTLFPHPKKDFSFSETAKTTTSQSINFTADESNADFYYWKFGDGATSFSSNPTYEYKREGNFDVKLTVKNKFGCESKFTKENAVQINFN